MPKLKPNKKAAITSTIAKKQTIPQLKINLQIIYQANHIPKLPQFKQWAKTALAERSKKPAEINIRIVNKEESAELNYKYRNKNCATNILSFPFEAPENLTLPLLGDLVICAPLVLEEALAQKKTIESHWAHLIIHGVLHLLGYTHNTEKNAQIMENIEVAIMKKLGFENPY